MTVERGLREQKLGGGKEFQIRDSSWIDRPARVRSNQLDDWVLSPFKFLKVGKMRVTPFSVRGIFIFSFNWPKPY